MFFRRIIVNPSLITPDSELSKSLDLFSVVLVEPSKPQNVGSIARVMMNFGFTNLILVNPQLNLAHPEIEIVARKAIKLVHRAQIAPEFTTIREHHDLLIGTTARPGDDYNLSRIAITPEQLDIQEVLATKTAIVFGREQFGLSNEEIEICNILLTIPTTPHYSVMNLSHAVAVVLYSIFKRLENDEIVTDGDFTKHRLATYRERKQLEKYFQKMLETTVYHPEKQRVASQAFSNILSRGYVTGRETTTLMGVFKWIDLNLQKKSS